MYEAPKKIRIDFEAVEAIANSLTGGGTLTGGGGLTILGSNEG